MPQSRKHSPISILLVCRQQGLLWQINALLFCIMHKPWAVCKRTPDPLTWCAVSLGQVSPKRPGESALPFLWHVERTPVGNSWRKLLSLISMPLLAALKQGGLKRTLFPVHHFVRYVGRIVFASSWNACPVTKLFLFFLLQNHTMTQHSS